jgi:hypothetical protein
MLWIASAVALAVARTEQKSSVGNANSRTTQGIKR